MITYNQIQEYCNYLGYVDNSKRAKNGIQYVKIQRWSEKEGYHRTKEVDTVCKMKLPVVESSTYVAYGKICFAYRTKELTLEQALDKFKAIGVKAVMKGSGISVVPPSKYEYNITMEQLKEYVDQGTKWSIVRENKKLERLIDAL